MKTLITLILGLIIVASAGAQNHNRGANRTGGRDSNSTSTSTTNTTTSSTSTSSSTENKSSVVSNTAVTPQRGTETQSSSKTNSSFSSATPQTNTRGNGSSVKSNSNGQREHTYGNPSNPQSVPSKGNGGYSNNNTHNSNNGGHANNPNYYEHKPSGNGSNHHQYHVGHGQTSPAGAPIAPSIAPRPYFGVSFPYRHVFRPERITSLRDYRMVRPYGVTTTMLVSIYGISDYDVSKLTLGLPTHLNVVNEYGTFERRYVEHADLLLAVRSVGYNYRRQMEYVLELIDLHDYSLISTWQIDNFFTSEEWNIERCISNNRYEIQRIMIEWDRIHY